MNYTELTAAIEDYTENTFTATELQTFVQQAEQRIYNSVQLANLRKNVTGNLTQRNKYLNTPSDFLSVYELAVFSYATTTATGTTGELTIDVASTTNIEVGQYVSGTGIAVGAQVESISGTEVTLTAENTNTVSGTVTFQGDYTYLLDKDVSYIRECYPSPSSIGVPKYYAIFGPIYNQVTELSLIVGPTPDKSYAVELHYYYYPESIVTATNTWLGDNFDSVLLYGSLVEAYTFMKGEADMMGLYDAKYKEALALLQNLGEGKQRGDAYRDGLIKIPAR
jgi:hypothetical protein